MSAQTPLFRVKAAGFGSIWREKNSPTVTGQYLLNTTGFVAGKKQVWSHIEVVTDSPSGQTTQSLGGFVRLNCNRQPPIIRFEDEVNRVFLCAGVEGIGTGKRRLLLHPPVAEPCEIDAFLVRLDSEKHGSIDFHKPPRFTGQIQLVSASCRNLVQEILLLMWTGSTVTTSLGELELPWILKRQ
jgi:hypothetical protein